MFQFTFRDVAGVIGVASFVVIVGVVAATVAWRRNDPRTRIGRLRQGLEQVQQGTAERDKMVEELTAP